MRTTRKGNSLLPRILLRLTIAGELIAYCNAASSQKASIPAPVAGSVPASAAAAGSPDASSFPPFKRNPSSSSSVTSPSGSGLPAGTGAENSSGVSPLFGVSVDRPVVSVGDRVTVTYSTRIPAGSTLKLETLVTPEPPEGKRPPGGAVLEFETPPAPVIGKPSENGTVPWKQTVSLLPFLAGTISVPGPHLLFRRPSGSAEVRPPSILLTVTSRLPQGEKPEQLAPKADRGIRLPPPPPIVWIALVLGVLLAFSLASWAIRRRRAGGAAASTADPLPPGAELLATLAKLAKRTDVPTGDPRPFYSELTHALKRYLERSLGLPVLEWTTFETVRQLREKGFDFPREIGLGELLAAADRVKFGRGAATREEARHHLTRARQLHAHLEALLAAPPFTPSVPASKERAS